MIGVYYGVEFCLKTLLEVIDKLGVIVIIILLLFFFVISTYVEFVRAEICVLESLVLWVSLSSSRNVRKFDRSTDLKLKEFESIKIETSLANDSTSHYLKYRVVWELAKSSWEYSLFWRRWEILDLIEWSVSLSQIMFYFLFILDGIKG